jgi:hypothetical protein
MNTKQTKELKQKEAITKIKEWLKPNDTLLIIQKSVSASGMSRKLRVFNQKSLFNITKDVAEIMGLRYNDDDTLTVTGCGMDMHFWLAYTLPSYLYGYKKSKKMTSLNGNGSLLGCFKWRSL